MSERTRTSELEEDAHYQEALSAADDEPHNGLLSNYARQQPRSRAPGLRQKQRQVSTAAQWNWTGEKTLADWRQSTHAWPSARKSRARLSKRSRTLIYGFSILLFVCALVGTPAYLVFHGQYDQDLALAHQGTQQIEAAGTLLKGLGNNPFNSKVVASAQQDFTAAIQSFTQLNAALQQIPGVITFIPHYGSMLTTAQKLVPVAIELSQAGIIACDALTVVIDRLHDPLNSQSQGITAADLQTVSRDFTQIQQIFNQATAQINQLSPDDVAQLDPRLGPAIQLFHTDLPQIQDAFQTIQTALSVAPSLLGIGTPTTYLIEMLDSTELRPGGGFIGNYGTLTISGGRLSKLFITDIDLLDRANGKDVPTIPLPSAYSWFLQGKVIWGMRDSNLDADFPTAANYAEILYHKEGGTADAQGVIALTPWLIQNMLKITGPIYVTEYKETITADNLVERIHYHQLLAEEGKDYVPDPHGHSSLRKRFTEILFEHFMARVQQLSATSSMSKFVRVALDALHTKDIQVYFNNTTAEALLAHAHIASTIEAPATGDSFMPVDANIVGNKSNDLIATTIQDQVTLDSNGNATHHTTLIYSWPKRPGGDNDYGAGRSDDYYDYVRFYVPTGAVLGSLQGLSHPGTGTAFSREVWSGFLGFYYGNTFSVTLVWTLPKAATKDATGWHYQDLIERPAGITWQLNYQLTLPSCAKIVGSPSGLTLQGPQQASAKQALTTDLTLSINYTC